MTTVQFSTGQAFDLPDSTDTNAERQLLATIRNNPQARYLAPILAGSLDVWAEMKLPVNDFHALLTAIVETCDQYPDATVTGYSTQQETDAEQRLAQPLDPPYLEPQVDDAPKLGPAAIAQQERFAASQVPEPLTVGPGDLLVIAMPAGSTYEQIDRLNAGIRAAYPDQRVMVIHGAQQLAVVKDTPEQQIRRLFADTKPGEFPNYDGGYYTALETVVQILDGTCDHHVECKCAPCVAVSSRYPS